MMVRWRDIHSIFNIAGLGIVSVCRVGREAESAMRRSNEVLHVSDAIGIEGYLDDLCDKVSEVYVATLREGEERLSGYNRIAAMVIEAALLVDSAEHLKSITCQNEPAGGQAAGCLSPE